jgi:hypothetical protein
MAGPAQRGSRGRGRAPRRGSSLRLAAVGQPVEPGAGISTRAASSSAQRPDETTQFLTRSTYRHLLTRGLLPEEAANLTAFLCGIPVADVHWSIGQVNRLLFLRELARTGRFGPYDGGLARPH